MEEIQHIISGALDNLASDSIIVAYDLETAAETVVIQDNNDQVLACSEAQILQEEQGFNSTIKFLEKAFPLTSVIPAKAGTQSNKYSAQRVELIFFLDQLKTTKEYHCVESLVGLGPGLRRDAGTVFEIKITDFAWVHSTVSTIYSVFHAFNDLLKDYDPYPDFPFPTVNAGPGYARTTTYARPTTYAAPSSNTGFEAMFRSHYANAGRGSMPATTSGNPAHTTQGAGKQGLAWLEAQRYPQGGSGFYNPGFNPSNQFSTAAFSTGVGSNIYNTAPLRSAIPSYTQIGDTNNFGYQHGGGLPNTAFTITNPFVPLVGIPIISATFATDKPFGSSPSPILSSSPSPILSSTYTPVLSSPPSPLNNGFASLIELHKFEPMAMPQFEPLRFEPAPAFSEMRPVIHEPIFTYQPEPQPVQEPKPFPPDGWVLGPNYIVASGKAWWLRLGPLEEELEEELGEQQEEEWQQARRDAQRQASEIFLLTFAEPNYEARRQYAEMQAQAAKDISAELKRLYGVFYAHNIWVDINYIRNILRLPIEDIISLLQNGLLADILLARARIIPQAAGAAPTGASGDGGNGDDSNDVAVNALIESFKKTGLDGHEGGANNGHAVEKHIGKSKEWLDERVKSDSRITGATSFPDIETANRYTLATLQRNAASIAEWLRNAEVKGKESFEAEFNDIVGYGYDRAGRYFEYIMKVRVILVKTDNGPSILTSYPLI